MYINGKEISKNKAEKLRSDFSALRHKKGKEISLGVFVVGDESATKSFIKIKKRFAEFVGVDFRLFAYSSEISESEFFENFLEEQEKVDGVIVQLPLPENFNIQNILEKIDRKKDVDLLNPENILDFENKKNKSGKMPEHDSGIFPPVAGAIWEIIRSTKYDLKDKKIVIVGKGELTGKPFGQLLKNLGFAKNKDFFFLDKDTEPAEKKELLKTADLIISGVGIPNLIKKEDIKDGVFLIDAGTSTANKKLVGDISLECSEEAKYFSKTPGGVGPVTVAVLYENLFKLVENNI